MIVFFVPKIKSLLCSVLVSSNKSERHLAKNLLEGNQAQVEATADQVGHGVPRNQQPLHRRHPRRDGPRLLCGQIQNKVPSQVFEVLFALPGMGFTNVKQLFGQCFDACVNKLLMK
jgi:hypothetical protein